MQAGSGGCHCDSPSPPARERNRENLPPIPENEAPPWAQLLTRWRRERGDGLPCEVAMRDRRSRGLSAKSHLYRVTRDVKPLQEKYSATHSKQAPKTPRRFADDLLHPCYPDLRATETPFRTTWLRTHVTRITAGGLSGDASGLYPPPPSPPHPPKEERGL